MQTGAEQLEALLASVRETGYALAKKAIADWGGDVIAIEVATKGHALYFVAHAILDAHDLPSACNIDPKTLHSFLLHVEERYGHNQNMLHGGK